jgi:hypothetical protein
LDDEWAGVLTPQDYSRVAETQKSSATRRTEILHAEMLQAADSRDAAAICTAYVRTAHRILAEFPNMSAQERQIHYVCLKDDIERLNVRAGQSSKVLGELKRLLG